MEPYVTDGDLVTLRPVTPRALRLGDLVLSHKPGLAPVLHRVVSRRCQSDRSWVIRTKGDAVGRLDSPVRGEHIVARAVSIRRESSRGECVELRLGAHRRALDLVLALASRFTPILFSALSRRLLARLRRRSRRARLGPVVA